jgi:hypothetical protein
LPPKRPAQSISGTFIVTERLGAEADFHQNSIDP